MTVSIVCLLSTSFVLDMACLLMRDFVTVVAGIYLNLESLMPPSVYVIKRSFWMDCSSQVARECRLSFSRCLYMARRAAESFWNLWCAWGGSNLLRPPGRNALGSCGLLFYRAIAF